MRELALASVSSTSTSSELGRDIAPLVIRQATVRLGAAGTAAQPA
jgi:hypothetical protein